LRLALSPAGAETPFTEHDPATRAYFRRLMQTREPPPASPTSPSLLGLLREAGIATEPEQRPPLLAGKAARRDQPLLLSALGWLAEHDPACFAERSEELAYLSNVLVAGAEVDGRRLRPFEAVELAIACVSAGLELSMALPATGTAPGAAAETLRRHPCDGLLRLAFARAAQARPQRARKNLPPSLERVRSLLKELKV
jgi:hypothetical protein